VTAGKTDDDLGLKGPNWKVIAMLLITVVVSLIAGWAGSQMRKVDTLDLRVTSLEINMASQQTALSHIQRGIDEVKRALEVHDRGERLSGGR
jgi:hypothetical protein